MRGFLQDARYAIRMLSKLPAFTIIAIVTIALGIGANTAIFTVVNGVLLRPLPFEHPDRLVRVFSNLTTFPNFPFNPNDFVDLRRQNHVFRHFAVYLRGDLQYADGARRPERLAGMQVSSGYFDVLGFRPALGRGIELQDEVREGQKAVVLSDPLWRRRFGSDPAIIGKPVRFSGEQYTVIGVMPAGLRHVGGSYRSLPYGHDVDVWTAFPLPTTTGDSRGSHFLNAIARLRDGVSLQAAEVELTAISQNIIKQYNNPYGNQKVTLKPLREEVVGRTERPLLVLLACVGFVLLIACSNVANLLLARSTARSREIAVRAALGAGIRRLMGQMVTESLLLAIAGGVLGILLAVFGVDFLLRIRPADLPRAQEIVLDSRVFLFTICAILGSGLLFGLAPALRVRRTDLNEALKQGGRGGTGRGQSRAGRILVVAEIALAFVLLTGTGLLLRTFLNIQRSDPGFRADNVATVAISLPPSRYKSTADAGAFYMRLVDRVRSLPGVQSAGAGSDLPWSGYDENSDFTVDGKQYKRGEEPHGRYHFVTPGFAQAIGIPLLSGRDFDSRDREDSQPVVIVNHALARTYLPDRPAVGAVLQLWGAKRTIVGVIGDVKDTPVSSGTEPSFYFPATQQVDSNLFLAVRQQPGSDAIPGVLASLGNLDRELAASEIRPLDNLAEQAVALQAFTLFLVSVFGIVAVLLAGIGIYGVMSYTVARRTHEIGIQLALGAPWRNVLTQVMGSALALAVIGVAIGFAGAASTTKALESMLYGVEPGDRATFGIAALAVLAVAALAALIPARRAISVDPMIALRDE